MVIDKICRHAKLALDQEQWQNTTVNVSRSTFVAWLAALVALLCPVFLCDASGLGFFWYMLSGIWLDFSTAFASYDKFRIWSALQIWLRSYRDTCMHAILSKSQWCLPLWEATTLLSMRCVLRDTRVAYWTLCSKLDKHHACTRNAKWSWYNDKRIHWPAHPCLPHHMIFVQHSLTWMSTTLQVQMHHLHHQVF